MSTPYHLAMAHMHLRAELERTANSGSLQLAPGWSELLEITRQLEQFIRLELPPCATDRSRAQQVVWPTASARQ